MILRRYVFYHRENLRNVSWIEATKLNVVVLSESHT